MRTFLVPLGLTGLLVLVSAALQPVPKVDHTSVALFDQIPEVYKVAAQALRVLVVDRSVGQNLSEGLSCLEKRYDLPASQGGAPTNCKRYLHVVPALSNNPEPWSYTLSRANIHYRNWPGNNAPPELACGLPSGSWQEKITCFTSYVQAHQGEYDVVLMLPSYLDANDAGLYAQAMATLRDQTSPRVWLGTSSYARMSLSGIGQFNAEVQLSAADAAFPLFDLGDIEQHDQWGAAWFDNRDGVPYTTSSCSENEPDDGIAAPSISARYTRECWGGHLGNPDVGKIRVAKAFWVLLAQEAGWIP